MASADSWFPVTGRHKVSVGSTLNKALRARKGSTAPKKTNLVQRDFFTFRYNFKPKTIDTQKPGSVDVKRGKDTSSVRVERPIVDAEDVHVWSGSENIAKEWECVLIYDEEMGTFTLEKLESLTNVRYEGHAPAKTRPAPSPVSTQEVASSPPQKPPRRTIVDELEAELLDGLEDADGEPDDGRGAVATASHTFRGGEEEDDDDEDVPIAAKLSPSRPKLALVKAKGVEKSIAPPSKVKAPLQKAKAATTSNIHKRPLESTDVEEFQISRPRPKRPKPSSPPPQKSFSLALPTSAGPDPLAYATSFAPEAPSAPTPPLPQPDSEDDEDEGEWDVVAAPPPVSMEEFSDPVPNPPLEDEEMDFIAVAFGEDSEPDLQMEEVDPADTSVTPAPPVSAGGPISLDDYAGGAGVAPADIADEDDDLFSSTDEDSD